MQPAGAEKSIKDWFKAGKSKWMPPLFVEAFVAMDEYAVKVGRSTGIPIKTIVAEVMSCCVGCLVMCCFLPVLCVFFFIFCFLFFVRCFCWSMYVTSCCDR